MFPVLIDSPTLQGRIQEMAGHLRHREFAAGGEDALLLCVLEGALPFTRQLCRFLGRGGEDFDRIRLSSYGAGTESSGRVEIVDDMGEDPRGRRVVVLEDIVDTGRTLHFLRHHLLSRGASAVEIYTLLDKPSRRVVDVPLERVGFEIPDHFVLGFGLDVAGQYRDLPYIGIYEEDLALQQRRKEA